MTDVLTPEQRKLNMSRIRNKDTQPEITVRSMVHRMGYRYSLHNSKLPGKPDLALTRHRKIIFVHGCFWHMHKCRYGKVQPKTNANFWKEKREKNVARDGKNLVMLKREGWKVLIVWECWAKNLESLGKRLTTFLKHR